MKHLSYFLLGLSLLAASGCNDIQREATEVVREQKYRAVKQAGESAREAAEKARTGNPEAAKEAAIKQAKEEKADAEVRDALRGDDAE